MPSFGWAPFGQSEPGQHAQHGAGFCERELCLHGDLRRGFNALSERDQAGSLRLGENKISILGHAAAPSVDSFGRSMHYSALSRWGGEPAFHSALRLRPGVPISFPPGTCPKASDEADGNTGRPQPGFFRITGKKYFVLYLSQAINFSYSTENGGRSQTI